MSTLLAVSGSVSAKLAPKLIAAIGGDIRTIATENAAKIMDVPDISCVCPTFDAELREYRATGKVWHIDYALDADKLVIAPADYNLIGKIANGIADDFVTSTIAAFIGTGKPIFIADAMNTNMFINPIYQENRTKLDALPQVRFIQPTVKKLACGTIGIGGLADVWTIAKIVNGHRWAFPIHPQDMAYNRPHSYLPRYGEPGYFGAVRKYDIHEGVDIYCRLGASVYAVEDGEVVDSYQYTGEAAGCGWWKDTWCVKVKGQAGVVTYGELLMPGKHCFGTYPAVGTRIKAGDWVGAVGQVLDPSKRRRDIRNHNTSMLHLELRTESCHIDGWKLGDDRDSRLLDPMPYLLSKDLIH